VDAIVPVTGTRRWIASLGLSVTLPWRPWHVAGQVGGYKLGYDGLTFATVRGAGHMVPYTQPQRALTLFVNFLEGAGF
jgi:serine carboxypeptidase-like clade II